MIKETNKNVWGYVLIMSFRLSGTGGQLMILYVIESALGI